MYQHITIVARIPIIIFILFLFQSTVTAQWKESQHGNEWIDYNKDYLRIQVTHGGIQKIRTADLPAKWRDTAPASWQLWHRGKEVAIIEADASGLVFFAQNNDGASDSLVHRPASSRLNPYISLYSDQGYYFLTTASDPARSAQNNLTYSPGNPVVPYHIRKDTVTYTNQLSFITWSPGQDLNHSYFNETNSWTGPTIVGPKAIPVNPQPRELNVPFTLKNWLKNEGLPKPTVEMLFNSLHFGVHDIHITAAGKLLGRVNFGGWGGRKINFEFSSDEVSEDGSGTFNIQSVSEHIYDWFGLSYYTIRYPQAISMETGATQKRFELPSLPGTGLFSLLIDNPSGNLKVFDVTNPYQTTIINGSNSAGQFRGTLNHDPNSPNQLIAVSDEKYHPVDAQNINEVDLTPLFRYDQTSASSGNEIAPEDYDFIIITTDTLKAGAREYAAYRSSPEGGNHRTLVMSIRNVYDQFNYGEPSPVAIRMFTKYMLSKGITKEHYLFLIGMGITHPPFITKELPNEVPSLGDPGSDNLIISGLHGVHEDLPAIPVGRLKAYNSAEISTYLKKVKSYEQESRDISWRKNILHLSGGQSGSEIIVLRDILKNLEPIVTSSNLGGQVTQVVKTTTAVERVDISNLVNEGVGMMTYFGHGAQTVTDLDFGYATDASRGFRNINRYPLMYFNGCGVGNIFTSRRIHILSDDWLTAPEKGAISIIANSYLSYVVPSSKHISNVYKSLFEGDEMKSIGHVLREANLEILTNGNPTEYDKANIHQATLQGDPSIVMVRVDSPDFIIDPDEGIKIKSETPSTSIGNSSKIRVGLAIKNGGKKIAPVDIPVRMVLRYKNGTSKTISESIPAMAYQDTLWVTMDKDEQIDLIKVNINPEEALDEFSFKNNEAELTLNWGEMGDLSLFPAFPTRDIISPIITSRFMGSPLETHTTLRNLSDVSFRIQDDRSLAVEPEAVNIYIKPCWDNTCEFEALDQNSAFSLSEGEDGRSVIVNISDAVSLAPGEYEIMVIAVDRAGNASPNPYQVKIKIGESITGSPLDIKVSPNPVAGSFVKFELVGESTEPIESAEYLIHNLNGQEILRREVSGASFSKNWYWTDTEVISSGLYLYTVNITFSDGTFRSFKGKLIKQ